MYLWPPALVILKAVPQLSTLTWHPFCSCYFVLMTLALFKIFHKTHISLHYYLWIMHIIHALVTWPSFSLLLLAACYKNDSSLVLPKIWLIICCLHQEFAISTVFYFHSICRSYHTHSPDFPSASVKHFDCICDWKIDMEYVQKILPIVLYLNCLIQDGNHSMGYLFWLQHYLLYLDIWLLTSSTKNAGII